MSDIKNNPPTTPTQSTVVTNNHVKSLTFQQLPKSQTPRNNCGTRTILRYEVTPVNNNRSKLLSESTCGDYVKFKILVIAIYSTYLNIT